MHMEEPIILGYACINTELRAHDIYVNRTFILKEFNKGIDETIKKAKVLALKNLYDLRRIIIWNELCGIKFMRMSSNMFPHITNHLAPSTYNLDFAKNILRKLGKLIKKYGHRVSFHPGQFNQLGTSNPDILKRTINELDIHCKVLDLMELDNNAVCIIHGGGAYGHKEDTLKIIEKNILNLPVHIRNRLCLENDEFTYGVTDLLPLCEKLNVVFCFDFFHHSIKNDTDLTHELLGRAIKTWTNKGLYPKFHISEQKENARKGTHSDFVINMPKILYDLPKMFNTKIYVTVEAKCKEQAIFKLFKKYFIRYNRGKKIYYIPKVLVNG